MAAMSDREQEELAARHAIMRDTVAAQAEQLAQAQARIRELELVRQHRCNMCGRRFLTTDRDFLSHDCVGRGGKCDGSPDHFLLLHSNWGAAEKRAEQAEARIRSLEETNQALQAREQHAIEQGRAFERETERLRAENAGIRQRNNALVREVRCEGLCTPEERAVLDAMLKIPDHTLNEWERRSFTTVQPLYKAEMARRAAKGGATDDNGFLRETIAALRAQKGGG